MFCDMTSLVNVRKYRTVSSTDFPNQGNVFVVYYLPVGHGRQFATNTIRWVNGAIGGWRWQDP